MVIFILQMASADLLGSHEAEGSLRDTTIGANSQESHLEGRAKLRNHRRWDIRGLGMLWLHAVELGLRTNRPSGMAIAQCESTSSTPITPILRSQHRPGISCFLASASKAAASSPPTTALILFMKRYPAHTAYLARFAIKHSIFLSFSSL